MTSAVLSLLACRQAEQAGMTSANLSLLACL